MKKLIRGVLALALMLAFSLCSVTPALAARDGSWQRDDDGWRYIQNDEAITGWLTLDNTFFYFGEDDLMVTGWQPIGSSRYYFTSEGVMVWGGWAQIDGAWYYFYDNGELATNCSIGGYSVDENGAYTPEDPEESIPEPHAHDDWVGALRAADDTDQLLVVSAEGSQAVISLHVRDEGGCWKQLFAVDGFIGENGLGKSQEGDKKTPVSVYHLTDAFGICADPGSAMPYTQVDDSFWWVGDPASDYFNLFISENDVERDWSDDNATHLIDCAPAYNYALALDYNHEREPAAGITVFIHCASDPAGPTDGGVAIPEEYMIQALQTVKRSCAVVIDSPESMRSH